jgi:hypothetical protein
MVVLPEFAWKDWGIPWKTWVITVGVPAGTEPEHIPNIITESYRCFNLLGGMEFGQDKIDSGLSLITEMKLGVELKQ